LLCCSFPLIREFPITFSFVGIRMIPRVISTLPESRGTYLFTESGSLSVTCQLHDEAETLNLKWSVSGNENNKKKCNIIHMCTYPHTYLSL